MTDHDRLRMLIDMGPALRAAGYSSLHVGKDGDWSATFIPPDPPMPAASAESQPEPSPHALDDPDTFGGVMPKRTPMLYEED